MGVLEYCTKTIGAVTNKAAQVVELVIHEL